MVESQAWSWALTLFVFGLFMPGVDNWAHAGGFAGGYLAAMWLDPLKPERTDHVVIALALPRPHAGVGRRCRSCAGFAPADGRRIARIHDRIGRL